MFVRVLSLLALPMFVLPLLASGGCSSVEAKSLQRPVVVDGRGVQDSINELGWAVHVTSLRLAVRDLEFTVEGEMHVSASSWLERASGLLVGTALAHPGHYAGGVIDGELAGRFLPNFITGDGAPMGMATVRAERYDGGNLTFRAADASDGLPANDPMLGHTAHIEGTAEQAGRSISFDALVDIDDGVRLVGAPLELDLRDEPAVTLGLQLLTSDPIEADTLWKKLDFGALDTDADGTLEITPASDGGNILRRNLQEHDFYRFTTR